MSDLYTIRFIGIFFYLYLFRQRVSFAVDFVFFRIKFDVLQSFWFVCYSFAQTMLRLRSLLLVESYHETTTRKKTTRKIRQKKMRKIHHKSFFQIKFILTIFYCISPCWLTKLDHKHFKALLKNESSVKFLFILHNRGGK